MGTYFPHTDALLSVTKSGSRSKRKRNRVCKSLLIHLCSRMALNRTDFQDPFDGGLSQHLLLFPRFRGATILGTPMVAAVRHVLKLCSIQDHRSN